MLPKLEFIGLHIYYLTVKIFVVVVVVVVIEKGRDVMFGTKAAELFKKSDTPHAAFARESTHF